MTQPGPRVAARRWQLTAASVTGHAHERDDMSNQDAVEVRSNAASSVVAAVVCDGAGTAARGGTGAALTARAMADALLHLGQGGRLAGMTDGEAKDWCVAQLEGVRQTLLEHGAPLNQYHCTFVGCVLSEHGSWLFQLGDSACLVASLPVPRAVPRLWFADDRFALYAGSRGAYVNETHFVTDDDWSRHLDVKALPMQADAVLLMSDGAMDVGIVRGAVFAGFLPVVVEQLHGIADRAERESLLARWLADPQTHRITGDDKTLFLALALPDEPIGADGRAASLTQDLADAPPGAPPITPSCDPSGESREGSGSGSAVMPTPAEPGAGDDTARPSSLGAALGVALLGSRRQRYALSTIALALVLAISMSMLWLASLREGSGAFFARWLGSGAAPGAVLEPVGPLAQRPGDHIALRVVSATGSQVRIVQADAGLRVTAAPCTRREPRDSAREVCHVDLQVAGDAAGGAHGVLLRVQAPAEPTPQDLRLRIDVQPGAR